MDRVVPPWSQFYEEGCFVCALDKFWTSPSALRYLCLLTSCLLSSPMDLQICLPIPFFFQQGTVLVIHQLFVKKLQLCHCFFPFEELRSQRDSDFLRSRRTAPAAAVKGWVCFACVAFLQQEQVPALDQSESCGVIVRTVDDISHLLRSAILALAKWSAQFKLII